MPFLTKMKTMAAHTTRQYLKVKLDLLQLQPSLELLIKFVLVIDCVLLLLSSTAIITMWKAFIQIQKNTH